MYGKRRFRIIIAFVAVFGLIIMGEIYVTNRIMHRGIGTVTLKHLNSVFGESITVNIKEAFESINDQIPLSDPNRTIQYEYRKFKIKTLGELITHRVLNKIKTQNELITHHVLNKIKTQDELITQREINNSNTQDELLTLLNVSKSIKRQGELITQRIINKIKTQNDLITHRVINKSKTHNELIAQREINNSKTQDELLTLLNVSKKIKRQGELITQRIINKIKTQNDLITHRVINKSKTHNELIAQREINNSKTQDELLTLLNVSKKIKRQGELITQRIINKIKTQNELITHHVLNKIKTHDELITQREINNSKIQDELLTLLNVSKKNERQGELITQRIIKKIKTQDVTQESKTQDDLTTQRIINKIQTQDGLITLDNITHESKTQGDLITQRIINKIKLNDLMSHFLIPSGFAGILNASIEELLPHYPNGTIPTDGIWQIVQGTLFKLFVYSAYYDKRNGRIIRIIGVIETRGLDKVWCRLWYSNQHRNSNNRPEYYSETVKAEFKIIREDDSLIYSVCFVICPLRMSGVTPQSVSIVMYLPDAPKNFLLIRNTDEDVKKMNFNNKDKIGICVKPFHFNYDQALYLIEYIELNTLLGVSHFAFYNYTLGPQSSCVLKHYVNGDISNNTKVDNDSGNADIIFKHNISNNSSENNNNSSNANITTIINKRNLQLDASSFSQHVKPTVTMLPWAIRMRSEKEFRTEVLFAALNDCLYRNMYSHKYLALIDLDEFIVPRHFHTILDLLSSLNLHDTNRNVGSYSFQNAYFYLQFPDDLLIYYKKLSGNAQLRASLITQRKTRRRLEVNTHTGQSKCICKTENVLEIGNNFIWKLLPGKESLNVPADAGILHHYKICEFGGDDCIKSPSVVDRTAIKYMKELVDRVNNVYNYLKKPCNLSNIPPLPTRSPTTATQL